MIWGHPHFRKLPCNNFRINHHILKGAVPDNMWAFVVIQGLKHIKTLNLWWLEPGEAHLPLQLPPQTVWLSEQSMPQLIAILTGEIMTDR